MKKVGLSAFLAIFCIILKAQGRDPEFTQVMGTPMFNNPAFAGFQENMRAGLQCKIDWARRSTGMVSGEMGLPKINSGIGIMLMSDIRAGLLTNSFNANYAYEFKLGEYKYLRFGICGSVIQQISNKMLIINPGPDDLQPIAQSPNVAAGALYYSKSFYAGASLFNIIGNSRKFIPFSQEIPTARRLDLQAGGFLKLGQSSINPFILLVHQGTVTQILPGVNYTSGMFTLGASYRHTDPSSDGLNFLLGFTKGKLKIGYSFDLTVADARSAPTGSHELTLVFQLQSPRDISNKPMIGHLINAF